MDFRGANMIESEMRDRLAAKNADIDRFRTENAALRAQLAEARTEIELAKRIDEARSQQPNWEKLWAEAIDRAEQAEADYAAALSALELANMPKVPEEAMFRAMELLAEANTRAERAEARVAELERDIAAKANNMRYMHDRFERAEARVAELEDHLERSGIYGNPGRYWEARWRDAEAERDALRDLLAKEE